MSGVEVNLRVLQHLEAEPESSPGRGQRGFGEMGGKPGKYDSLAL